MIQLGKNITAASDVLIKVNIDQIYNAIKKPKTENINYIRQLRLIRTIDIKRYNVLKRKLPYLVCGIFNPPYRNSENFAYIQYFILDIDKISEKDISIEQLRNNIQKDDRVVLCFVSPGEDGLKVMFKLKEKCYDKGIFSLFYKTFAHQFATQYNITQVLDFKTSDVTRACFVSYDEQVYYNPQAVEVDISAYVSHDNPQAMRDLQSHWEKEEKIFQAEKTSAGKTETEVENNVANDIDKEVMDKIKSILKPPSALKPPKDVFVPQQLNEMIDDLVKYIVQTGVEVTEVVNISYAKKIRIRLRMRQAEVNVFYGKKGYSVVKSPRAGTDDELNEMMVALIQTYLLQ